ncbi:MAG: monofunctional biosynthetic peptidoglycan transglycosylase [Betaproteobacteria bacterium]|nr:monofunctional biosynthetic peptidoglycan transglycosylase [Betaproteobacteria bacterium]
MASFRRWLALVVISGLGLQLFFVARIFCMRFIDPESTAFQRTEAVRLARKNDSLMWRQDWIPTDQHPNAIKRAVIASEDDVFASHAGVQWEAIERAWNKNARAQARAASRAPAAANASKSVKVVGGSTITQQLAKNLFLSGERTLMRKGQELFLTLALEQLLTKQRILEIYLNSVEWGEGVFGIEAAAQHYFRHSARQLQAWECARLAVMLPRPKYYEKFPYSPYLAGRAQTILTRMPQVELP